MPTAPKTAPENEAQPAGQTIAVDWRGVTLNLPATADDWDLDTLEAFEQGKAVTVVRSLLGPDYDTIRVAYRKANGKPITVGDLNDLLELIAQTYGFGGAGD